MWTLHDEVQVEVVDLVVWNACRGPNFSTHGGQETQTSRIGDGEVDADGVRDVVIVPVDHHICLECLHVDPVHFTGIHQVEELGSWDDFHIVDVDLVSLAVCR